MKNKKRLIFVGIIVVIIIIAGVFYVLDKNSNYDISDEPVLMSYSNSVYGYSLALPSSWKDKFQINSTDADIVSFFYIGSHPSAEIFRVEVFDESDSVEGKKISSKNGKIFAYLINSEKPYSGISADEFDGLKNQVKSIIKTFKFSQ